MEDYYNDGFNTGYGRGYLNDHHDAPTSDGDRYSYNRGLEYGMRRRDISRELDREEYGDDY
jgi:hypothetical protein